MLREIGLEISILTKELAIHSKRKTVKERDIELAYKEMFNCPKSIISVKKTFKFPLSN